MSTQLIIIKRNTVCNEVCLQIHCTEQCESQHCWARERMKCLLLSRVTSKEGG